MSALLMNLAVRSAAFAFAQTLSASVIAVKLLNNKVNERDLKTCALAATVAAATIGSFILLSATFNPFTAGAIIGSVVGGFIAFNDNQNDAINVLIGLVAGGILGTGAVVLYFQ
jgi:hypothetical protein